MSNYTVAIGWLGKDTLSDSDPAKVISGADFNTEFNTVQTAINTKADLAGSSTQSFNTSTANASSNTTIAASTAYVTNAVSTLAATKQDTLTSTSNGYGTKTISSSEATGGSDKDVWYQV